MRLIPLLAGLLACGPALAQSVPPKVAAPTDPLHAVNKAFLDATVAALSARIPSGTAGAANGAAVLDATGKLPAAGISGLAPVATSGSYADLANKPAIPAAPPLASSTVPGLIKLGPDFAIAADGTVTIPGQVPVPSTVAATPSDAVPTVDGRSFTIQQIAAEVAAINGTGSGGATPAPAGTTITFTGPAGTPTGNQVLTALGANPTAGVALDGAGNLVLPGTAYTGGVFTSVPMTGDGDLTITRDVASTAELYIPFRSNTANTSGYSLLLNGTAASSGSGSMRLDKVVNGSGFTVASNPIAITGVKAIRINCAGGTFKIYLDDTLVWTVTDPSNVIPSGYYGVLTAAAAVSNKIAQVGFRQLIASSGAANDGTLSGLPSTIVAGQPLSATTYTQTAAPAFFVLYKVASATEEGLRWASGVMPGNLNLLIPQTAGAYTVRGFAAATGGAATYESAQVNVTAAPGALPATPTQTADTGATSSGVTMNWTATAPSYRVLTRAGVGAAYGSLADATVSANSYTFTGRPANSSPRAVVIPQNANGYGAPSGQFLSYTTP